MSYEHVTSGGFTFSQHQSMAAAWCRWNGQKGTLQQASRVMGRLTAPQLHRMLSERRALPIGCEQPVVAA